MRRKIEQPSEALIAARLADGECDEMPPAAGQARHQRPSRRHHRRR